MYDWLFKDMHVVKLDLLAMLGNYPLKLNNATNTCVINLKIILYHAFSLHIYEYL